jgi:NitT/TauT family transport system permease protein
MRQENSRRHSSFSAISAVFLGLVFVLVLWEAIALGTNQTFLPEFFACLRQAFYFLSLSATWVDLGYSCLRILISLVISFILGTLLGQLSGYFPWLEKFLYPLVTVLKALPTVALVLLLVIYVPHFSLYVVSIVLFPVIYQASLQGASQAYQRFWPILELEGRCHWIKNITKVTLPLSADYLILALLQAVGMGFKVEVMAETFARTNLFKGIGADIYFCYTELDYSSMMAYVLIVLLVSLALDGLLLWLKKKAQQSLAEQKRQ